MDIKDNIVWIFNGENSRFASAVFIKKDDAETWINNNELSGILTAYPLNESVYDWAIKNSFFTPQKEKDYSSDFIQKFTSASQEHYHYEKGNKE